MNDKHEAPVFATVNDERRTNEDIANARLPCGLICQPTLVRLETRETDGHFGDDARHDRAEPLVQRQWGFTLHDADSSRDDAARFRLPRRCSIQCAACAGIEWVRTPVATPDLESCMRTLMVSSGWQHN